MASEQNFERELSALINMRSRENGSETPDFILAGFLSAALTAFDDAVKQRSNWYGQTLPTPAVGAAGEAVAWALQHDQNDVRPWMDMTCNPEVAAKWERYYTGRVVPLYAHPSAGAGVISTDCFVVPTGCVAVAPNVFVSGREIVVTGTPHPTDDENDPRYHNCDAMGCGRDHVVYRAALTRPTSEGREDV